MWQAHIILINEIYLSDCMAFGFLVDPSQQKYQLAGPQAEVVVPRTPISSDLSVASPPVKRVNRRAPTQTPSRSEGSDERAAGRQLELLAEAYATRRKEETKHAQSRKDALDEAISEAKQIDGLVSDSLSSTFS